ncbi:MAG TPA: cation diffusion facilitator family transporter, partial [Longimicrobiaceae bacterium]|nr:cation diffusion facilitator family transporter [Longimicrobiaceae bacterium]
MGAGHHHGGHHHHHGHASHRDELGAASQRNRRRLKLTLALTAVYLVAEVVGGLLANSLALLADAGHMLSDVGALGLSLFAMWIAQRPATPRRTFGYYRTEILAALANGAALIGISLYIFVEAYQRLRTPEPVQGELMLWVATGGLVVNLLGLLILRAGKDESLNVRGAWLHLLTDALGSVGAILGGVAIWRFGWFWADPAVSALIGVLVIYSAWDLMR